MPNIEDIKNAIGYTEDLADPGATIGKDPRDTVTNDSYDTQQTIELARKDLDFFAGLVIPDVINILFPVFFVAVWQLLLEKLTLVRDFSKLAIGIPRGFAKTTFMKLFIVYCVVFSTRKCILIVASTATLAENVLSDIADMLDGGNIRTLFGNWRIGMQRDAREQKVFTFRGRAISITAMGAGGNMRGLNLKHMRPDLILMEDIQSREAAQSAIESKALYEWMLSTLMKMRAHTGCLYIFVGNMYPFEGSILRKLKANTQWVKLITGGILADGKSLWEELQPIEQLLAEFRHDIEAGHPEIFLSEVQNDEGWGGRSGVDVRKIPSIHPSVLKEMPAGSFIIIDPSGKRKRSNNTVIGHFDVYDGKPVLRHLLNKVLSPGDTIKAALVMAMTYRVPLICVEDVAYQDSLLYWFNFFAERISLEGLAFRPVSPMGITKVARIKKAMQMLLSGEVLLAGSVRAEVLSQIISYDPLSSKNIDDILDILGYTYQVLEKYSMELSQPLVIDSASEWHTAKVLPEHQTSAI